MNPWREALILRQSNPQKEISTTNTRVVVAAAVHWRATGAIREKSPPCDDRH